MLNLPISSKEQKQRRDELIGPLLLAEQQAQVFIDDVMAERNETLENELEAIRKQGRAQQQIIDRLSANQQQKEFEFHSCRKAAEWCLDELNSLRRTRVSRWASKDDRDALRKKITKAEQAVRQANAEAVRSTNEHNAAADALAKALEVMGKISNGEIRLRGELTGRTYADPETALPIVPR